jgi:hypothetical protein
VNDEEEKYRLFSPERIKKYEHLPTVQSIRNPSLDKKMPLQNL